MKDLRCRHTFFVEDGWFFLKTKISKNFNTVQKIVDFMDKQRTVNFVRFNKFANEVRGWDRPCMNCVEIGHVPFCKVATLSFNPHVMRVSWFFSTFQDPLATEKSMTEFLQRRAYAHGHFFQNGTHCTSDGDEEAHWDGTMLLGKHRGPNMVVHLNGKSFTSREFFRKGNFCNPCVNLDDAALVQNATFTLNNVNFTTSEVRWPPTWT